MRRFISILAGVSLGISIALAGVVSPVVSPVTNPVVSSIFGSAVTSLLDPTFQVFSNGSIEPEYGTGSATFSRAGTPLVQDHEGVYRAVAANEARMMGLRRVENLTTQSGDFDNAAWTKSNATITSSITDPDGGSTAQTLTATAGNGAIYEGITTVNGANYTNSVWIRRRTGTGTIYLKTVANINTDITSSVTTSWQRFSTSAATAATTSYVGVVLVTSGDAVDIWHPQMEHVSGQTSVAPGEYVATGAATASQYFTTTNGNSVASNVVTEADGDALYPTVTDESTDYSIPRKRQPAAIARNTAYSVGDWVLPDNFNHTVINEQSSFALEVTVAGTTHASTEVDMSGRSHGDTFTDGTATLQAHTYTKRGAIFEGAATNAWLKSYDLTAWNNLQTPTKTLTGTGLDGAANKATILGDDDGTQIEYIWLTSSVTANTDVHVVRYFIAKDNDETRFPQFGFDLGGSLRGYWRLNTKTGAIDADSGNGSAAAAVHGTTNEWVLTISVTNDGTGTTLQQVLAAAWGTTISANNVAATGTVEIRGVEHYAASTIAAQQYASPIITNGSSASRTSEKAQLKYALANWSDGDHTLLADVIPLTHTLAGEHSLIGTSGYSDLYITPSAGRVGTYDGTTVGTRDDGAMSEGDVLRAAARRDAGTSKQQAAANGTAGTEVAYDGTRRETTDPFAITDGSVYGFIIDNVIILDTGLSESDIETLTERD